MKYKPDISLILSGLGLIAMGLVLLGILYIKQDVPVSVTLLASGNCIFCGGLAIISSFRGRREETAEASSEEVA